MYTFKFKDYNFEIRKHSNGILIVLSNENIPDKIKIGINTAGDIYILENFSWNPVPDYKNSIGICEYIFNEYLGDVNCDKIDINVLADFIEDVLKNREVSTTSGKSYVIEDGKIFNA